MHKEQLTMETQAQPDPILVIKRLQSAINQHDLDAFVTCIDPAYQSEQPVHPDRIFQGQNQARKNWSQVFSGIPDIEATLLRCTSEGKTVWAEWHWKGTYTDGTLFSMRGVTIFGIQQGRIRWGRLYMEPVEEVGADIDASVQQLYKPGSQPEDQGKTS
jgi:limonene-1,2-epoxide hydrolase